ncbi:MAG: TlpA family protein disulfide reductase [Caldilineae bacterium]|nr:MAG: TlpA family protein disulfide reductase [Caldilineae bacterium]
MLHRKDAEDTENASGNSGRWGMRQLSIVTLLIMGLFLAACTPPAEAQPSAGGFSTINLADFPQELGAGFPTAQVMENTATADVGEEAPNFAFVLADGRGQELEGLRGKVVVINFWATWCGPCRAEMPELVALHRSNANVVVLEVNVQESLDAIRPFAEEFAMTMPVIVDEDGDVRKLYGVRNLPTTVFVQPDGKIGARWAGLLTGDQLELFVQQMGG